VQIRLTHLKRAINCSNDESVPDDSAMRPNRSDVSFDGAAGTNYFFQDRNNIGKVALTPKGKTKALVAAD
jgi:hypothetical protein